MSRDRERSGYNGLRPIGGGVPVIGGGMGQPTEQQKVAIIRQQMQAMSDAIYVRAASAYLLVTEDSSLEATPEAFEELAQNCQMAAKSYFVGIGLIELERPVSDSTLKDQTGQ